ncbi:MULTISPECIES: hypothetical protein [Bacillus]|uniref:Uncharacterized protein n=2 Tax=Bacillus cereus group TaxID=86661 RepID=A0A2B0Y2A8_BACAN|nr:MULTISPECIES: hypothetical protein [Bacillus]KZD41961.1 putative lipoprotein [Bacillus cereus]MBJ8060043.1 hypothetical protein [Bacillus cereus]MCU4756166.1 hypothetical protein [Bacillus cereus]MCU5106149.1 hypothetical protein [Bacillus cereus]MCU5338573.1 hypothetical protein [Bacillus cereus]
MIKKITRVVLTAVMPIGIILDNKDEAGLVWKQIERGSIIEVQYGKDRNDIVGVQLVGDREPYEISDKFDRNTINEIVENVKGNL